MRSLKPVFLLFTLCFPLLFTSCGSSVDRSNQMVVSVRDQKMLLVKDNKPVKAYPISTSKFGLGSQRGSNRTPLGNHVVAKKIGGGAPKGAVFKSRRRTGAIVRPNTPGRDPIVTRILWLSGRDRHNKNTFGRCVYIHGTPAEYNIGRPASYGCVRMKSEDVIDLYRRVGVGAGVKIIRGSLDTTRAGRTYYARRGGRDRATATRW
ncbi:MAG: lipoprotein-anchoring transpeptidase ErfK/SrfK [Paracoccaceae bacterium]|jgi:lipoprotein-anchoring transpeptidase ErfK/SrfK